MVRLQGAIGKWRLRRFTVQAATEEEARTKTIAAANFAGYEPNHTTDAAPVSDY